ncbi:MAG: hypothetical protein MJ100_06255 [Ruminococcus sp.]|nr:hypothetical protein [Ruminococcus sp.]
MKEKWENAELEIIDFAVEDIITTSFMSDGGGNGDGGYKSGPDGLGGFGDL